MNVLLLVFYTKTNKQCQGGDVVARYKIANQIVKVYAKKGGRSDLFSLDNGITTATVIP